MITLYGHVNTKSPNTLKLRVALRELGVAYNYVPVDLAQGEQRTPDFLRLNPHGKIPVLVDDGFCLPESDAILWYVAESHPGKGLLPQDRRGRAQALRWCDFASTGVYPAYSDLWRHTHFLAEAQRVRSIADDARNRLERCLGVLEQITATASCLVGSYSIADIAVASVLSSLVQRVPDISLPQRRHVSAWYERVLARPAFQAELA